MIGQDKNRVQGTGYRGQLKPWVLLSVFFLFIVHCPLFTDVADAATLYYQAANQTVFEGQTFVADFFINTDEVNLNTVDLKLRYSNETLEVLEATPGSSVISLWIQPPKANQAQGELSLIGGVPNGFNGANVPVFRVTFRASKSGVANISLDPASRILKNDGSGQSETLRFQNLSFTVQPKDFQTYEVLSPTHSDQNLWYKNRDVIINFTPKPNEEYSFSFSANPDIIPEDKVAPVQTKFEFDDRPDGVYYFKALARIPAGGWKEAVIYRVQVDGTAPELFSPEISSEASIFEGKRFVSFSTLDKVSGISHYMVKVGMFSRFQTAVSPYILNRPIVGDIIEIKAIDNAGNERVVTLPHRGYLSEFWFKIILILIGVVSLATLWKIKHKKQESEIQL